MADTYSTDLRIRLQEDGANSSTWGQITNTNLELLEDAISGMVSIATTGGTTTLTTVNGADDQARYAIVKLTGVLVSNATVEVPASTKQYLIWNATTGSYTLQVKTSAGTGPYIMQGSSAFVFCDGTDVLVADKSNVDSTFRIYDETDPTKIAAFQLSGITTGTTRTLTIPDASTTLVGTDATQTLTNKTLTSPTITTSPTAAGATWTNLGSVTTVDINGGTIDGTTQASGTINGPIAAGGTWTAAATWTLPAHTLGGTVTSNGQSFSGTIANLGTVTTVDINGGTVDGAVIGGASAAAGTFTTLTSTGNAALGDAEATDTHAIKGATTILSNSASAALTVTNTGSGNSFVVEDSASTDSTPFVIDSGGSVIGSHTGIVSAAGGVAPTWQKHGWSGSGTSGGYYGAFRWSADAVAPGVQFAKSRGLTPNAGGVVSSGDGLGIIDFAGDDGSGGATPVFLRAARIIAEVDGTPGTNDMPGRLVFSTTADGASSPTERYRIASDGKHTYAGYAALTNSTNNAAFTITNTGSGNSFVVEDSASTDSTPFVIDAAGYVVSGHTASIQLPVGNGAANNAQIEALGGSGAASAFGAVLYNAAASGFGACLSLGKSNNNTVGSHTVVASGDLLGSVFFSGSDGTNFIRAAQILGYADGTPGTNDMPGRLVFSTTADGASSPTERYRIASDGKHTKTGYVQVDNSTNNAAFTITNTGSGNSFVVEDSASTDSTPFVIDANGFVRQGHSATVSALGYQQAIEVYGQSGTIGQYRFSNDASGTELVLAKSRGASIGTNTIVQSGDAICIIRGAAADGTNFIEAARISFACDGTPGTNDMPGRLVFSTTADGASSPTERYRIASDGKHTKTGYVQVDNSTNNAAFTITNTGSGNSFVVEDSASTDSTPFVIDASGNVVVGHTALITASQSTNSVFQVHGTTGSLSSAALTRWSADANPQTTIFQKSRGASAGTRGIVSSGDDICRLEFAADDGTNFIPAVQILAEVDGTPGTNDMPGRLVFSTTADGASSTTERMRIDSSGNVIVTGAGGLGYGTGSGGAVTQTTNRTTGVTLNKTNGAITLVSAAGTTSWQSFTVTNSTVAATDVIKVCQKSGTDLYMIHVTAVAAGSFRITYATTAGTTTEQPVFNFAVIKAVAA